MYYYVLKYQGVEETLYLLLLVAKKNRKNVDTQNNKGKVKIKYYIVVFRSARASWNTSVSPSVSPLVSPQEKFGSHIYRLICPMNHLKTHQTSLMAPWDPLNAPLDPLGPPGPPIDPQ